MSNICAASTKLSVELIRCWVVLTCQEFHELHSIAPESFRGTIYWCLAKSGHSESPSMLITLTSHQWLILTRPLDLVSPVGLVVLKLRK